MSRARDGFARRAVLGALGRMNEGCLVISLPEGGERVIGTPGTGVQARLRVVRESFFARCLLYGDIGFGEAYVDGDWETDSVERVIAWAIANVKNSPGLSGSAARSAGLNLLRLWNRALHRLRPNSIATARRNIAEHYDLGNAFYRLWLDETVTYSSALFEREDATLAEAQEAKYEALCRKARIGPGDRVLEIGCGWGGFAVHAARRHGAIVTAVTISREQHRFACERIEREGLSDRVAVLLQDYRAIEGRFDRIVSIEMMEALGDRYLPVFCERLHRLLDPKGIAALQYITVPESRHRELRRGVDWIQKHIFPGSLLLSVGRVGGALARAGDLFLQDLEDLGQSYARTLREWRRNFGDRLPEIRALGFDDRFIRKWNYYLQYCEAAFALRNISVVQAVYGRPNNPLP